MRATSYQQQSSSSQHLAVAVDVESELNDLQERLNHVERQLKLKTSETARLKKKVNELEQASKDAANSSQSKQSEANIFTAALAAKSGGNPDERRTLLLKAQNTQLTKQNAYLHEISTKQIKVVKEAEAVIFQARKRLKDVKEVSEETQDGLKQLLSRIRQV